MGYCTGIGIHVRGLFWLKRRSHGGKDESKRYVTSKLNIVVVTQNSNVTRVAVCNAVKRCGRSFQYLIFLIIPHPESICT